MSEAITLYDRIQDPLAAVDRLGDTFSKSGMFGCEKAEQGRVLALACLAERKNPFEILRTYHLIQGRLTMRSDAMLAEYHRRGGKVKWKQSDEKAALAVWSYLENENVEIGFTIEDAQRAQLIRPKSGWVTFPDAMLRARCISKALRMIAPEVVAGVYLPDERPVEADVYSAPIQAQEPILPPQPKAAKNGGEAPVIIDVKPEPEAPAQGAVTASPPPILPANESEFALREKFFTEFESAKEKVIAFIHKKAGQDGWPTKEEVAGSDYAKLCQLLNAKKIEKALSESGKKLFLAAINR